MDMIFLGKGKEYVAIVYNLEQTKLLEFPATSPHDGVLHYNVFVNDVPENDKGIIHYVYRCYQDWHVLEEFPFMDELEKALESHGFKK